MLELKLYYLTKYLLNKFRRLYVMGDKEKKGKIEESAEKTGEVVGKIGKKGWGVVKGFGKGVKKGFEEKNKEEKEE
jgi:hypothetical protein